MSLDLSTRILPAPSGSVLGHEFRDHCQCEEPPERRAPSASAARKKRPLAFCSGGFADAHRKRVQKETARKKRENRVEPAGRTPKSKHVAFG